MNILKWFGSGLALTAALVVLAGCGQANTGSNTGSSGTSTVQTTSAVAVAAVITTQ